MASKSISGCFYNWTITRHPETPWRHRYHQSLVDKMSLAIKGNPETGEVPKVLCTFEQALERMRRIDQLTRGIPKITYLVGWQHDGHDSKYPDMSVVNHRLKRPQDATARDSLLWLMKAARKYHTTVSLHINMFDAYKNSPLWEEYLAKDLIIKSDGKLHEQDWAKWDGEQAYWIDYAKEWASGLAQKRIDALVRMLDLSKVGTIHIDSFYLPQMSDADLQIAAMRKILRYWISKGVDPTTERLYASHPSDGFIGLQPMAWHINLPSWGYSEQNLEVHKERWMEIQPALCCGGVDWLDLERGQLFGTSMQGQHVRDDAEFKERFCLQTVPWCFLNHGERVGLTKEDQTYILTLSHDVTVRLADKHRVVTQKDRLVIDGDDVFVPALWHGKQREIIAYSRQGYTSRQWQLPPQWRQVRTVDIRTVSADGVAPLTSARVKRGWLSLRVAAGQMLSIVPHVAQKRCSLVPQGGMNRE